MIMNETLKTIYQRRAVRKYKKRAVDSGLIEQIVDAGRMAPSAMNRQLWKFYVLTDVKQIHDLSTAITSVVKDYYEWAHSVDNLKTTDIIFHNAPAVIFITAPKDYLWGGIDVGACCQNMLLAAKSLGLDSCPIGLARYLDKTDKISLLDISDTEKIYIAVTIGYGNEKPDAHERKMDNLKFIDTSKRV